MMKIFLLCKCGWACVFEIFNRKVWKLFWWECVASYLCTPQLKNADKFFKMNCECEEKEKKSLIEFVW